MEFELNIQHVLKQFDVHLTFPQKIISNCPVDFHSTQLPLNVVFSITT